MIEALLDTGAHLKGRSVLRIAAREGRLDVTALFLERGVDINEFPKNEDLDVIDYDAVLRTRFVRLPGEDKRRHWKCCLKEARICI
jgi:hypothetical protein